MKSILILALIISSFSQGWAQMLMHYTSEKYDYSVRLPEDWRRNDELKGDNLAMVVVSPENGSLSFAFYSMKDVNSEEFIENYQKSLEKQLPMIQVHEKGNFKSRDDQATYLVIDFEKDGKKKREKVCFYPRKKEMAVVTASDNKETFHQMTPVLDDVFASFTFETKQEVVDPE
ncbi:MAG: PsbP-related protein [Vicingaceae bacterium]